MKSQIVGSGCNQECDDLESLVRSEKPIEGDNLPNESDIDKANQGFFRFDLFSRLRVAF